MRSAGNFSPEWGYLAPAPSFLRTFRVVLVATAVGATAGAGAVLPLVDRPSAESEKTAVPTHAVVTAVPAAAATRVEAPTAAAPVAAVPPISGPTGAPVAPTATAAFPSVPVQNSPARVATPLALQSAPAPQVPTSIAPDSAERPPATGASSAPAVPTLANGAVESGAEASVATQAQSPNGVAVLSGTSASGEAAGGDQAAPPPQAQPQRKTKHRSAGFAPPNLGAALRHLFSARAYYPNHGL
jgi:hypothetical protein